MLLQIRAPCIVHCALFIELLGIKHWYWVGTLHYALGTENLRAMAGITLAFSGLQ